MDCEGRHNLKQMSGGNRSSGQTQRCFAIKQDLAKQVDFREIDNLVAPRTQNFPEREESKIVQVLKKPPQRQRTCRWLRRSAQMGSCAAAGTAGVRYRVFAFCASTLFAANPGEQRLLVAPR